MSRFGMIVEDPFYDEDGVLVDEDWDTDEGDWQDDAASQTDDYSPHNTVNS